MVNVFKVDDVEFWHSGVSARISKERIIGDKRQVRELEVIHEHGEALRNMLRDDMADDKV
jgi:hypothetical protein